MTRITKANPIFKNMFETQSWLPASIHLMDDMFNAKEQHSMPAVNIHETEKSFVLEFKTPGFEKENFKITLENEVLKVSAEVLKETSEVEKNFSRREFSVRSFSRSFNLPETIDADGLEAKYENGILSIVLPKKLEVANTILKEIKVS